MAHDSESESQSAMRACRRAICLSKALEHVWQKISRDARAGVAHFDLHVRFILADTNTNRPADGRKLRGVRQQVPDHLLQPIDVARDDLQPFLKLHLDTDVFYFQSWSNCIEGGLQDRDQIDWSKMKLKFSGDDARHVEDVFDDLFLRPRVSFDHFNRMNTAFIVEATRFQNP